MASVFLDTLMLRHGPRWHPMAKQFAAVNPSNWQSTFSGGVMLAPMGVWGQKPPTETRSSKTAAQHGTNSWFRMPVGGTPHPPCRKPESQLISEKWENLNNGNYRLRPSLKRQEQIPGRFFPKPSLTDEERVLLAAKTGRPLSSSFLMSNKYQGIKKLAERISFAPASTQRPSRPTSSCNQKIAATRKSLFDHNANVVKSEVFMISFRDEEKSSYDPTSELHSDYYTLKRQIRFAPVRQVSTPSNQVVFGDVICGKATRMHSRG